VAPAGIGRLLRSFADEPSKWRAAAEGGKHHMGTTRITVILVSVWLTSTAAFTARRTCS
jgi:hypothetical protein